MASGRVLNFFDLTSVGVGSSLGIGIFVLIGELTKNVTGPAVVISILLAGLSAMLAGLCIAEFGVRFLKADSAYVYCYSCNKESVAFIIGWTLVLEYTTGAASVTKGIVTFIDALAKNKISDLLREVVPINFEYVSPYFDLVTLAVVLLLTVFVLCGMTDSIAVKNIFTVCNVGVLLAVIIAGSFKADVKNWHFAGPNEEKSEGGLAPFGFVSVIEGAAIALYGFIGFDNVGTSGHEVRKLEKNIPLAILASIFLTLVVFVGISVILTLMCPCSEHNVYAALPFAFEKIQWTAFKWIVVVGAFFGFQTSLFGVIFPLPRVIYSMANDALLLPFFNKNNYRFKTPVGATLAGGLLTAVAVTFFTFQLLVSLTVIATLFVCTILAINVILLRYAANSEENEVSEDFMHAYTQESCIHLKAAIRHCFNFKSKIPSKLTEKIIILDVILFCASSAGLSVIFRLFSRSLLNFEVGALVPAILLLCLMLFALISITRQPKTQNLLSFRVPLMPFIPCLSIFLNIFLMVSLGLSTWILFSVWMALGILPHLIWYCLKCTSGQLYENSLYQINRMNMMKLNESIVKMKSEKKSFYEGAINPVFFDESKSEFNDMKTSPENCKAMNNAERASLQLKEAEIIQTAELIVEEKTEPLEENHEVKLEFLQANSMDDGDTIEISENIPSKDEAEKLHLECVAEIHTNEEFLEESVMLEIVESTYHFLSDVVEELPKNEIVLKNLANFNPLSNGSEGSLEGSKNKEYSPGAEEGNSVTTSENQEGMVPLPPPFPNRSLLPENKNRFSRAENSDEDYGATLKRVISEIRRRTKKKTESVESQERDIFTENLEELKNSEENKTKQENSTEISGVKEKEEVVHSASSNYNSKNDIDKKSQDKMSSREEKERSIDLVNNEHVKQRKKQGGNAATSESITHMIPENIKDSPIRGNNVEILSENSLNKEAKQDENNKTKEFKKKLNRLLKNQVNSDSPFTRSLIISKSSNKKTEEGDTEINSQKNGDNIYNFRTLNKLEIKDKLELLLSKGPPTRPSLKNSFNIKVEDPDCEDNLEIKINNKELGVNNSKIVPGNDKPQVNYGGVEDISPNELKEKKETLINISSKCEELPEDAYC